MPFTIEEFRDLVRILEERPEWRAELRRLVPTDEILTLPALVRELIEAQHHTMYRLDTMADDMAVVKGIVLEGRYRDRAYPYFAPLIRRTHVLSGEELDMLLEGAVAQGQLSEAEADELLLADLLLRGRRRADNAEAYVVIEISWKIDPYDVERSVRRATLMSRMGIPAIPVVAGNEVLAEAANLASMLHVWQLTDSRAISPQQPGSANDQSPTHA